MKSVVSCRLSVVSRQLAESTLPSTNNQQPTTTDFTFHVSRFSLHVAPWVFPLGIFLLALVLRLWALDGYGLWYDEVASVEIASRGPVAIITDRFGGMLVQTPLHYLIVWLTIQPVDPATTSVLVRLPSVLAGALTVLVVYGLGKEMFGRAQGLLAAALVAVSAVHIEHSQDVRPYAMLVLFTSLSAYTLVRAEKEGTRARWVAFTASLVAALYISYFTITLFLPAFVPYLLWVLYRLWRRSDVIRPLLHALAAMLVAALASIPLLVDLLSIHRTAPDLALLTPRLLLDQFVLLLTRTTQLGIGGTFEEVVQWGLFVLAVLGVYLAFRAGRGRFAVLCVLIVVVPALMLAVFKTTNQVFQRYAIFVMPFYFLLIATGARDFGFWILDFGRPTHEPTGSKIQNPKSKIVHGVLGTVLLGLFAVSAYLYFDPQQHSRFSYLPDYRGAAQALASRATQNDLIVLADEPALGAAVMNFYWHGSPPAPTFDARDPLLYGRQVKGNAYWIVSFFQNNPEFLRSLPSEPGWSDATFLERIDIVRQGPSTRVNASMEQLLGSMDAQLAAIRLAKFQPVSTLHGCLYQAEGQIDKAAQSYEQAGEYFPELGGEFLSTAEGYAERGNEAMAWREAITSKMMYPGDAAVHDFLADRLRRQGHQVESGVETQIAQALRGLSSTTK